MVRDVLRMGNPRLFEGAAEVDAFDTLFLHQLVEDLTETMHARQGVGLAAPQIGVSLRVVVFGGQPSQRYPEAELIPFTVLCNPILTPQTEVFVKDWEGCLSVPGLRGVVPRYQSLHYRGLDATGKLVERTVSGFHARVVQHECDHLDGILYPMRMKDFGQFGFTEELFPELAKE